MTRLTGYVTEALVLRVIPYGETSQVVHLATPEHGLVAALAKGALKPDSEVQGGLGVLALGEAHLRPAPRRGGDDGLELLQRFRQRDLWRGLTRDRARYRAAAHVIELLRAFLKPALPVPALYRAAVTALRALARAEPAALGRWVVWFEARAAAAAGHRPALEACGACGEPLRGSLVFAPAAGGVAHRACATQGPTRPLGAAGRAALTRLYTQRLAAFVDEGLTPAEVRLARAVHDLWLPWVLERRLPTLEGLPTGAAPSSA